MKLTWKHNSGNNEATYDWYLWINGRPTEHLISKNYGAYYSYIYGEKKSIDSTLAQAKEFILNILGL